MSNYRSMIDEALQSARARLDAGSGDLMKTASVSSHTDFLTKEASELADALEYVAHAATGTGSAADSVRGEMIRSFFKSASGSPAQGPTTTSGTQAHAPSASKRKVAVNNASGGSPAQGSAQPEAKDGEKVMLESFKQAEGQSLYDILMASKTAGKGGPSEHDSETMAGVTTAKENSNYRSILHSNEGPVNVTKRTAKAPVRKRLAEAFASTSDTTGDAGVSALFPIGAGKGTHKVASQDAATLGGLAFGPIGAAIGAEDGRRIPAALGSLGGGLAGGTLGAGLGAVGGGLLGALARDPDAVVAGAALGSVLGAGGGVVGGRTLGARLGHGPSTSERLKKVASLGSTLKNVGGKASVSKGNGNSLEWLSR